MESGKPVILCIDDEQVNLKLLEAVLVPRGYRTILSKSGEEALQIIQEKKVDLVLLDVMMPELDGYTVCKRIKENMVTRNIPVIMITVLSSKEDRIIGIEAGADDFLTKPFDQEIVLARVRMLLKMRDLNNRLQHGYNNITRLSNFGEEILTGFDPKNFHFFENISKIVTQVLRQSGDVQDKPLIVIVGLARKNNWQWYQYESAFNELYQTKLNLNLQDFINYPDTEKSRVSFFNEGEFRESELQELVHVLESECLISVANCISYISEELCIFSLNYGRDVTVYDASVLNSLVMQSLFLKSLSNQIRETEDSLEYTVRTLVRASETNDRDSGNHVLRVGAFSALLAEELKMPRNFIKEIWLQSQMHDVGMIKVSSAVLQKTGKLTYEDWEMIRRHPLYGAQIIGSDRKFRMARNIAFTHHEKWDGSGYPNGLKHEKIPVSGRIVALADTYDSMRIPKVYKPPMAHEDALKVIVEGDNKCRPEHFDPRVLEAFKNVSHKFAEIFSKLDDTEKK